MGQLRSQCKDFHEASNIWDFFENPPRKFNLHYNVKKTNRYTFQYTFIKISRWYNLSMRKISAIRFMENQNTQFILTCFWKTWHLWNYAETYSRAGHVTEVNRLLLWTGRYSRLLLWKAVQQTVVMNSRYSRLLLRKGRYSRLLLWTVVQQTVVMKSGIADCCYEQ
jgi:hypothetical protein